MTLMGRLGILVFLLFLGCNGPLLLLPGGKLDGSGESAPMNWSMAGDAGTVQLETDPEDPYSVNVAYTVLDGELYINAGDTETQWVKNIAADPQVRLRLKGHLYDVRAVRVSDPTEIARFGHAWTNQSMFRRDPVTLDQLWLYRLVAR